MVDADKKNSDAARIVEEELVGEAIAIAFVGDLRFDNWGGEADRGDVGYYEDRERE
jgi:hypothetical protein